MAGRAVWGIAVSAGAASLLAVATPAKADADLTKEVATTIEQTHVAAAAPDLASVHTGLHAIINCLVGPHDSAFIASDGDPCKGQGDGAIRDTKDRPTLVLLRYALKKAIRGLRTDDLDKARQYAVEARAYLVQIH